MAIEQARGADRADPVDPGIAVGRVADERQVVGNRAPARRRTSRARRLRRGSSCARRSTCTTRSPRTHWREILVGRPDAAPARRASSPSAIARRRRERIVGLELDHRPDDDAHRGERVLERMELREQRRLDALAGLVAGPEVVAKRLDDVVGGDADVRRAAARASRAPSAARRRTAPQRPVGALGEAAQAVEVAEQLVGAVDEVDDHSGSMPAALMTRPHFCDSAGLELARARRASRSSRHRCRCSRRTPSPPRSWSPRRAARAGARRPPAACSPARRRRTSSPCRSP